MKSRALAILLLLCTCSAIMAEDGTDTLPHRKKMGWLKRVVRGFSKIDTSYIEQQKYNFTVMLQNTTSFEGYTLRSTNGQEIAFSPLPSIKLGPYVGWRWLFLGYTIDLRHMSAGKTRHDFNLSLYANQVGVDLFYRKSGENYKVSNLKLGDAFDTSPMKDIDFDGFKSSEKGLNFYYIFNHKKFSYPAAYSQSTIQRRSCGTALAGIGYTQHSISVDWQKLYTLVDQRMGEGTVATAGLDTTFQTSDISYSDFSISGGYAYNWVFAHNWLFDISLQGALGYKESHSNVNSEKRGWFRDFDFHKLNIDGVLRTGLVWNNMRWYGGLSAVFHTYNYKQKRFRANTTFGNVNLYFGYNFGKR